MTVIYPLLTLDGAFNNSTSYQARNKNQQLEDGEVKAYIQDGLNATNHTRKIDYNLQGISNKITIENFLKERQGRKPFRFNPFADSTETDNLYICSDFSFARMSASDVYRFSATFEQVYR